MDEEQARQAAIEFLVKALKTNNSNDAYMLREKLEVARLILSATQSTPIPAAGS